MPGVAAPLLEHLLDDDGLIVARIAAPNTSVSFP